VLTRWIDGSYGQRQLGFPAEKLSVAPPVKPCQATKIITIFKLEAQLSRQLWRSNIKPGIHSFKVLLLSPSISLSFWCFLSLLGIKAKSIIMKSIMSSTSLQELLALPFLFSCVSGTCYLPDGTLAPGAYRCNNAISGHSTCCGIGSICWSSKLS
jgi:hypothetical protein